MNDETDAPVISVSVVTPARDAADTLRETLDSLLAQTHAAWEAIVVDDGSTDSTAEIAARLAELDPRIQVVRQPPLGIAAARNAGLARARFEWVLFLDADDWILPTALERLTALVAADPRLGAAYCGWSRVLPENRLVDETYWPEPDDLFPLFARFCALAFPGCCVVRRDLVQSVGGFDTSLRACDDWDLWQRVARAGARFGMVRESLARYRQRPDTVSTRARQLLAEGLRVVATGHGPDPRVPNPTPDYANGIGAELLDEARLGFACWPAGILLGQGADARATLEPLRHASAPGLDPADVAWSLFNAALLPRCEPPAAWGELLPRIEEQLDRFLAALEARTAAGFAAAVRAALERIIEESTAGPGDEASPAPSDPGDPGDPTC